MIKLVLTDLDDTLVPLTNHGEAPARTLAAVRTLLDAGLHFGPVTGRTPAGVKGAFQGDERCFATGAFANGQVVMLDGKVICQAYADADALQHVADIMDEEGTGALALYDLDVDLKACFVSRDPKRCEAGFGWHLNTFTIEDHVAAPSLKANIHVVGDLAYRTRLRDRLRAEVPELDFIFPNIHAPLIDITPAGHGKGAAVRILAEALGLRLDEVATFGDSENDFSMLKAVPNSVVVANASPEAKAAARWEIGPSSEEGMADALLDIAWAAATGTMPRFMRS